MKLSIIIVSYNTVGLTRACVESLLQQNLPAKTEIIVIDNASHDDTVLLLRSDFPEVSVLANSTNVGLAAAVNRGLRESRGDYCLILNPDVVALEGAIGQLIDYMDEHSDVGVAGGKLLSPNGKLQYSCYRFYRMMTIFYRRTWLGQTSWGRAANHSFLMKDFDHARVREVDWLMGACLMVRMRALQAVGGMDERFFLYFEDVDWCRRFWQAGWRVTYVPRALFSHYHQRSSEQSSALGLLTNSAVRHHVTSAVKYFWKYRGQRLPRIDAPEVV